MSRVGAVAIGRNEGDRLRLCLESLVGRCAGVVYVDSGSTDGSVALARSLGVEVVELDLSTPFTAARARNAGFVRLMGICPDLHAVQFVDGDCELVGGWLERACAELVARPEVAIVCGRVRERHPERSIYNRLADIEWDIPLGDVMSCGGIFAVESEAFRMVGGFDQALIAGEEPELCQRLRRAGSKILCVDAEMTRHDLDMTRFGQWWRRMIRFGYAAPDVMARHPDGPFRRQIRSARLWTIGWAAALAASAGLWAACGRYGLALLVFVALAPIVQALRLATHASGRLTDTRAALAYGFLIVIGKWAEIAGQARFFGDRIAGRRPLLIEYKDPIGSANPVLGEPGVVRGPGRSLAS